jgi:ubiquinone/menaquinone biosynthesis C-methylase UbiE
MRGNSVGTGNIVTQRKWIEEKLISLPAGMRILDAGAGEQQYKKYCSHLNYVSQDFAQYNGIGDSIGLQVGKWSNVNLDIISDISHIPEPDASFDIILCTEVFEHLPNPIAAIQEFSRLLKKDGQLIITAPFCSLTHFSPYHFLF